MRAYTYCTVDTRECITHISNNRSSPTGITTCVAARRPKSALYKNNRIPYGVQWSFVQLIEFPSKKRIDPKLFFDQKNNDFCVLQYTRRVRK